MKQRPLSIGEFVQGISPGRRRPMQLELQEVASSLAYAALEPFLVRNEAPKPGTMLRVMYEEHWEAFTRGDLRVLHL